MPRWLWWILAAVGAYAAAVVYGVFVGLVHDLSRGKDLGDRYRGHRRR